MKLSGVVVTALSLCGATTHAFAPVINGHARKVSALAMAEGEEEGPILNRWSRYVHK